MDGENLPERVRARADALPGVILEDPFNPTGSHSKWAVECLCS
ncbi:hypothetical protein EDF60_0006 [Leucobacter luti]|nr:hypothetical protein [Leucobacter luti]TCK46463.1 hypothetical protein EDF60_0006 [Leucobacter luti]